MFVQIVIELLGVPRAIEHVAGVVVHVGLDRLLHLRHRREPVVTCGVRADQAGLTFDEREQRRDRLRETGEDEVVDSRVEHPLVQVDPIVGGADELGIEEREGDVVSRCVDDDVEVIGGAVVEVNRRPVESVDVGLGDDITGAEPERQLDRLGRMRFEELVIGRR